MLFLDTFLKRAPFLPAYVMRDPETKVDSYPPVKQATDCDRALEFSAFGLPKCSSLTNMKVHKLGMYFLVWVLSCCGILHKVSSPQLFISKLDSSGTLIYIEGCNISKFHLLLLRSELSCVTLCLSKRILLKELVNENWSSDRFFLETFLKAF